MKYLHKMLARGFCVLLSISLLTGIMPMKVVIADDGLPPTVPVGIWITVHTTYDEIRLCTENPLGYTMFTRSPALENISVVIYRYGEYFRTVTTDFYGDARFFSYSLTRAEFNSMFEDGRMRPFDRYTARIKSAGDFHFNPDVFPITFQDRFLSIRADVFLYVYPLFYGNIPVYNQGRAMPWRHHCDFDFAAMQVGRRINPTNQDGFCVMYKFDETVHIHNRYFDFLTERDQSAIVPNVVDVSIIQNVGTYGNDVTVLHVSDIEDGIIVRVYDDKREEIGDRGQWSLRTFYMFAPDTPYATDNVWIEHSQPLYSSSQWLDDVPWRNLPWYRLPWYEWYTYSEGIRRTSWRDLHLRHSSNRTWLDDHAFILPAKYLPQDTGFIYEFSTAGITFHLMRAEVEE